MAKKRQEMPQEAYEYFASHPVEFVENLILNLTLEEQKANKPWRRVEPEQRQILNAVVQYPRVAVRSGHGIGKTSSIAWLVLWWTFCFDNARVIITGPKFDQLKITTWAEVGTWFHKAIALHDQLEYTAERLVHKGSPQTWFAQIVTSRERESLTGIHEEHVLVVADEASGEAIDKIADALFGCTTRPHNRLVFVGNPTRTQGAMYDAFHIHQRLWHRLHFNSEKSAIVDKAWLEMMAEKFNREGDVYASRVLGNFPSGNPRSIIPFSDCEAARQREVQPGNILQMGVDPALEGDDLMTIATWQGDVLHPLETFAKTTPAMQYLHVLNTVRKMRKQTGIQSLIRIKVDAHGGHGAALIESIALNEEDNIEVVPIYSNAKSTNPEYKNYGTQMWYELAADIHKVSLPEDSNLIDELSGRLWKPADLTVMTMEPKIEFKERLGHSPDRADATVLGRASGPRKVFSRQSTSESNVRDFDVDWNLDHTFDVNYSGVIPFNALHYVGMVFTKDLTLVALGGVYHYHTDRLWLYGEWMQDAPVVELFVPQLKTDTHWRKFEDERRPIYIGNEAMFHARGDVRPMAQVMQQETALRVREPVRYDELGAIGLGTQMYNSGKIVLHSDIHKTRHQLSLWSVGAKKLNDEEFPLCKCLLLMLSEIKRRKKDQPHPIPIHDYRPIGVGPVGEMGQKNPNAWMGM